jgi:hypothetical protein
MYDLLNIDFKTFFCSIVCGLIVMRISHNGNSISTIYYLTNHLS